MKIAATEPKPLITPAGPERKTAARKGGAGEASATVALASTAALSSAAAGADFDAAKVERVALAIRGGSYKINAEAIADKLIANAAELLGKTPR